MRLCRSVSHISHRAAPPRSVLRLFALTALLVIMGSTCSTALALGRQASGTGHAGLYTLTAWEKESGVRIPIFVWYPTVRPERTVTLDSYTLSVAREGLPEEGLHPVVLLSHGMAESGLAHNDTAAFLARRGYVVIAPSHPGDTAHNTERIFTAEQLTSRPEHLRAALEMVLKHTELGPITDENDVTVVGYGPGAAAALLLAGAVPDTSSMRNYCAHAPADDPICSPWATRRLAPLLDTPNHTLQPPTGVQWAEPRVRSLVLVAPAYGMLFSVESVLDIRLPIIILEAAEDTMAPPPLHARHLADILATVQQKRPLYFTLEKATSFMLTTPCNNELMIESAPAICRPPHPDSQDARDAVNDLILRFLSLQNGRTSSAPSP